MTLIDQETLDLFGRTVRGVLEGDGDRTDALLASGWRDVLLTDAAAAVPLVFRAQGELRASTAALDDVALEAAADGADDRLAALDGVGYVHPSGAHPVAAQLRDGQLVVDGLTFASRARDRVAFLAFLDGRAALVAVPADALPPARPGGLDPSLGLARVRGVVPERAVEVHADAVADGVEAACRRAIAYEMVGLASTMLRTTAEYAGARVQFGQPIGAFQAVKHRLADVLVAVQGAEVTADESWLADSVGDQWLAAAATKCLAGRAARLASENCLQVMGAIGFTLEHDLHRFIARATVLDLLYGSAKQLRVEVGEALLARARMPRPGSP